MSVIVERNSKRPLVVVHDHRKAKDPRNSKIAPSDSDETSLSDTSVERSCDDVGHRSKKAAISTNLSDVRGSADGQRRYVENGTGTISDTVNGTIEDKEDNRDALSGETDSETRKDNGPNTSVKTKKKKRRRYLTICTSNCKYDVVRRVAARFGMREVTEDSSWNLYWTDLSVSVERAKDMKRFQKVNHFPGMTEICRKDLLARNLNRMLRLFPKDYNFFPKTWCFPADHGDAMAYSKLKRTKTYIIKPDTGCQGRGIYLTKNLRDVKPNDRMICQVYVSRPFLIDGYKFDLRIYALITSCDPLRIYVYNDGLARFATSRYKEPTGHNTSNVFMHLTNYAVNKHSRMYVIDDEIGSKRKISTLNKWLMVQDVNVDHLWARIDEIIIKTILAAYPILKHSYNTCFPTHDKTYACFELLGFDVLLDWKLKPYLLEVNHSPSFHTDAQIDKDVKESLLADTFEMLNLNQCDKRKIIEEDRKRVRDRLLQGITSKEYNPNDSGPGQRMDKSDIDHIQQQFKWEDEHMGNFRRVYPTPDCGKYDPFFKQSGTSVFQDTAASRAREEASKLQREENEVKIREQEGKRVFGKWSEQKLGPESPGTMKKVNSASVNQERGRSLAVLKKAALSSNAKKAATAAGAPTALCSFEPEIISESEERERVTALAQRDFLIKSYGILEQIYMAMKRNGTLRPMDERKYGMYGRLGYANDTTQSVCSIGQKFQHYQNCPLAIQAKRDSLTNRSSRHTLKASKSKTADGNAECKSPGKTGRRDERTLSFPNAHSEEAIDKSDVITEGARSAGLRIICNEAPVYVRPRIPQKFWIDEPNSNDLTGRINKAHVARTLSNTVRLHILEKRETHNSSNIK